jgi:hypothetical protein
MVFGTLPIFSAVAVFKDKYINKFLKKKCPNEGAMGYNEKLDVKAWFPP